jgi:hypothetical protein
MQTDKLRDNLSTDKCAEPSGTGFVMQFALRPLFIAATIVASLGTIVLWLRLIRLQPSAIVFVLTIILALIAQIYWLQYIGPWRSLTRRYGIALRPPGKRFNFVSGVMAREKVFTFHLCTLACCVSAAGLSLTKMVWLPRPLQRNILIPWEDLTVFKQPRGSATFVTGDIHIVLHGRRVTEAISLYASNATSR